MGIYGIGKYAKLVPNAVIVGFTIGIAVSIALTNFEDILGIENFKDFIGQDEEVKGGLLYNINTSFKNLHQINLYSVFLGLLTFVFAKYLLKVSIYIPGPVIAMGISTILAATLFADKNIILVKDIYGSIPNDFFKLQLPFLPKLSSSVLFDILYFVIGIVFISGVESILCSSMADRLAKNDRTPFNPDKEFFGQGLVQIVTPLVQGFPCTGALARTATSIRAGAKTPLAGYFKAFLKLTMAFYLAQYLELIPMACIGGILVWVASNMIKPSEIKEIKQLGKFDFSMMLYTAIMVPMTDFLTGVLSALIIYFLVKYAFTRIKKKNKK
jgi:SulP family sulfate permease